MQQRSDRLAEPLPAASAEPRVLDLAHLDRQTFGDRDFAREILGLYLDHVAKCLADLKAAADAKAWRDTAHALKGTSRNVGAVALGELAAEAERLGGAGSDRDRATALARIEEGVARVGEAIARRLAAA